MKQVILALHQGVVKAQKRGSLQYHRHRSNPVIKNFYTQLRARGKYPKSALTACMRKLLVILNAMLHNKTRWQTPVLTSSTSALSPFMGAVPEHGCC